MIRYLTAGESHGESLLAIVEGMPSNLKVTADDINRDLARRQSGAGRGGRMRIESDRVEILSGIRGGRTMGGPVALRIRNRDWDNWKELMAPEEGIAEGRAVTRPRPGHADLAGGIKYDHKDLRNVLERASARETAARVAAGALARILLARFGIAVTGQVLSIGASPTSRVELTRPEQAAALDASPVRCLDAEAAAAMVAAIESATADGDTLGGVFEVRAFGLPVGLGSYVHWDRRLDGDLARALMSIPSVKGVEIGLGFAGAHTPGKEAHDAIFYERGKGFFRKTNRAGGVEGGVSNGEVLVVRAAVKPIPTLGQPLPSVSLLSRQPAPGATERSDVTAVPAACVIGEAAVAWTVAAHLCEKFGGDSLDEMHRSFNAWQASVKAL
jgi:chorismate synthase